MKAKLLSLIITSICLASCGSFARSSEDGTMPGMITDHTAQIYEGPKQLTENCPEAGRTMERYTQMLAELPPDDILIRRENVTYPEFEKYTYYSNTAGRDTPVNVLLPAKYSTEKKYPVVYILHGYTDNEDWMTRDIVHISTMLTNLVNDGEAKEMIVVCPYIYCSSEHPICTGWNAESDLAYDNFINDMTTDLMPYIEKTFSVAAGRDNTAITGFSMGGRESLYISLSYPDRFAYVGAVCAAPGLVKGTGGDPCIFDDSKRLDYGCNEPELLLLSAAKNDGAVGTSPLLYKTMFGKNDQELVWHQMENTGHDHSSVTPHLYNFFRMTFTEG